MVLWCFMGEKDRSCVVLLVENQGNTTGRWIKTKIMDEFLLI